MLFPEMPGMVSYTYRTSFSKDLPATLDTLQAMGIKDMEFSSLFGRFFREQIPLLCWRSMEIDSN
jgi:hypothetical protein